jgi:hypothetical protein
MFCEYKKMHKEWICKRCGRRTEFGGAIKEDSMPIAKCRIPDDYFMTQNCGYIGAFKLKGVGDILLDLFKNLGYTINPISPERTFATYLNKRGIDWCSRNRDGVVEWLKAESNRRGLTILPSTLKAIVRLSILKARQQEV